MSSEARPPASTVVIAVYNRIAGLHAAIESVLAQTDGDFEVLVVDDGSSVAFDAEVSDDPRVRRLRHEENRGYAAVVNTAFTAARGTWTIFLDSDDELTPTALAELRAAGENAAADAVFCRIATVDAQGHRASLAWAPPGRLTGASAGRRGSAAEALAAIVRGRLIGNVHLLLRTAAVTVPAPEGNVYADIVFLMENLAHMGRVAYVDEPLYTCFVGPATSSGSLRSTSWHLTRLPRAVARAVEGRLPPSTVRALVGSARRLVIAQLLAKAARAEATPLRADILHWCRAQHRFGDARRAWADGNRQAALALAALRLGPGAHRVLYRLCDRWRMSRRAPA